MHEELELQDEKIAKSFTAPIVKSFNDLLLALSIQKSLIWNYMLYNKMLNLSCVRTVSGIK
jgi:hypothetical protein